MLDGDGRNESFMLRQRGLNLSAQYRCSCSDFDMLVRRSLLLPKRPAVVVLSAATIRFNAADLTLFYHIPENDKLVLAQYYGVPLLSLRGASYHHAQTLHMSAQLNASAPDSAEALRLARKVRKDLGPENYQKCVCIGSCVCVCS